MNTLDQLQLHLAHEAATLPSGTLFKASAPPIICNDGSTMSVQASWTHYCCPRDNTGPYTHVEVWCIEGTPESWNEYGGVMEPFAFIPIEMVAEEIDRRGGFSATLCEPNK